MIRDVIRQLQKASVRPNDFTSRYSQLLERLWQRKDEQNSASNNGVDNNSVNNNGINNNNVHNSRVDNNVTSTSTSMQASTEIMPGPSQPITYTTPDDFSWLDLQAVGELVSGQQEASFGLDGYTQFMTMSGGEWNDLGLMEGDDMNRLF